MSLRGSRLSSCERSNFTATLLEDSSVNYGNLSSQNISKTLPDESVKRNTNNMPYLRTLKTGLNDTSNHHRKEFSQSKSGNFHSTMLDVAEETSNGSLKEMHKDSVVEMDFTIACINNEEYDSVIPLEDDEVMEIEEMPSTDMFAHLQPEKATEENLPAKEITEETCQQNESIVEAYTSCYPQNENELFQNPLVEVGRRLWSSTAEKQHYTKGCLWSPDGTCILVPVHLDGMHVMELPTDLYTLQEFPDSRNLDTLTSAVHVKEGGTVYDCCWYPYMNSGNPATCCWLATRQHEPIHMWDAFSGDLRCTYRGYNEVDEVESAISIIFSNDGEKVIGGFKKNIKIFDTNVPGRNCSSIPVKKAVSCFSLTTDNDNCVTAGNWSGYINHYDLRAPKLGSLFTLGGHSGGVTWLKYSPTVDKSWYLFSGARKDNKILQWDMRNYTEPLQIFERTVQTNQRIYFDLTPLNTWLASGATDGILRLWNLADKDVMFEMPLHQDCCNGISFHPSLPIISTTSGQFHCEDITESGDSSTEKVIDYENSLLMLWYGPSKKQITE